jgi:hypothetical protein
MKNTFKALKFPFVLLLVFLSFIACEKDFTTIESGVLGEENADFTTPHESIQITAYNKILDSLKINGLASNLLGVYNDPAYGQTTANIVAQIVPTAYNPDFGTNTTIDSVVLKIPYYYRSITDSTYTVSDSVFGDSKIKLQIFKNTYFLRDFNPNEPLGTSQNYYAKSDGTILNGTSIIDFENFKTDIIYENPDFFPSNKRIKLNTYDDTGEVQSTEYLTPALRTKLDTTFWRTNIINKQGGPELSNASNFKNYFRGLYFKTEAINNDGNMILLNIASTNANIIIYYSKDSTVDGERTKSTYTFNFTQNIINTFTNNYNLVTFPTPNKTTGDERLYLKGAQGSMAVIDLFTGTVPYTDENNVTTNIPALEAFKKTYRVYDANGYKKDDNDNFILKRLINDAQLTVFEDESIETGNYTDYHKYDRIYAYDIKNNTTTIDYSIDPIVNDQFPLSSRVFSLSQRDTLQAKFKIRLTEHLNDILLRDSTNTKIGLVLSNNVNYTTNAKILNSNDAVTAVPSAAIISPRGTVLHGTNSNVAGKKMKLEVYYTEPKEIVKK